MLQGLIKGVVFGFMVALIGCYQGFHASGGGRGVGMGTTRAVVIGSVSTLVLDYFLTDILLSIFGSGRRRVSAGARARVTGVGGPRVKAVSAGVRVAILFLLLAVGGYLVWKNLGQDPAGDGATHAVRQVPRRLRAADGQQGRGRRHAEGRGHPARRSTAATRRSTFKIAATIPVWSSAVVIKKATSLLGDNYLEIDPGERDAAGPRRHDRRRSPCSAPPCPTYDDRSAEVAIRAGRSRT